jgi:hypothetical protein
VIRVLRTGQKGLAGACKRLRGGLTGPVGRDPRLSLREELAHLSEQYAGRRIGLLERIDSLQPGQHCTGLVHRVHASRRTPKRVRRIRAVLARQCLRGEGPGPRANAEERFVQRLDELCAIAVREGLDDRTPDCIVR